MSSITTVHCTQKKRGSIGSQFIVKEKRTRWEVVGNQMIMRSKVNAEGIGKITRMNNREGFRSRFIMSKTMLSGDGHRD